MIKQRYQFVKENEYEYQGVFEQNCINCQTVNQVWSQRDDCPEYYTKVSTECINCREQIAWDLPVN